MDTEKFYITTAIDYINAKPHIGHAYEKVASDVLARFYSQKLGKENTFFLTGTDEHGAKIAKAAETAGQPVEEFAKETAAKFFLAWNNLNIVPSRFIRTTEVDHIKTVEEILTKIKDDGYVYESEYEGYYCTACENFYTETDAPDHICPIHKTPLELIKEKNWFLKISEFAPIIAKKIETDELKVWPLERKNEILSMLKQGFNDIAISRPNVKWGIPLPWDTEQTVYVWVDALINYVTGAKTESKNWWPASMHVVGKDISKFHCIIWPAILLAAGLELPKQVVVHGYLTIGGEKISKTTGNVIDPNDWVGKFGTDAVRYLLLREVAFGQDGDVSEEKLKGRYESDLANGLGNLVSRVTTLWEKFGNGKLDLTAQPVHELFGVDALIENFAFHQALQEIWNAVKAANECVDHNKLWELGKTDEDQFIHITNQLLVTIKQIGEHLTPFVPSTAEKINNIFKQEKITKAEPLFPRIV